MPQCDRMCNNQSPGFGPSCLDILAMTILAIIFALRYSMGHNGSQRDIMLEKPDIQDEAILTSVRDNYDLPVVQVTFLPWGADRDTAVYRGFSDNDQSYFLKLRSGTFDAMTIAVPRLLHEQGIAQIIAPLRTQSGGLWADLDRFKLTVFPFVEGRDGYMLTLSDQHWIDFGRAMKGIHTAKLPSDIRDQIHREDYSDQWRERVKAFQIMAAENDFADPVAIEFASFLNRERKAIGHLVQRAEDLAGAMKSQSEPLVLCHGDMHAGNAFIDNGDRLFVVDWDTLVLAPKERDLMYAGGGQFCNHRPPEEEERLFYQGYGSTEADPVGLAYYRYERIVQDIAEYCAMILPTEGDSADRENGSRQLQSQFAPGAVVELTYRSEQFLPAELRVTQ